MLTEKPCQHSDKRLCGGYYTDTEFEMARIRPGMSVQEYHDILVTFEIAFDNMEDGYARAKQASSDQECG